MSRRSFEKPIVAICIAMFIASSAQSQQSAIDSSLVVLPSKVIATPDYPAHVAVFRKQDDGALTWIETPSAETIDVQVEQKEIADFGSDRKLHFVAAGDTQLKVMSDGHEQTVPVAAHLDDSYTYDREVASAISKAGCNLGACHGNLHGKGGFRLSLRGDDPRFDYDRLTSEYAGRRIDLFEPSESLILKKATNQIAHQGGQRFAHDSLEYDRIVRWIQQGASWKDSSQLKSIEVVPASVRISHPNRRSQVIVLATFEDGSVRDVTRWSRIEPSLASGVQVSADGVIEASRPLDVALNVSYLSGRAAARVAFLGESSQSNDTNLAQVNPIDSLVEEQLKQLHIAPEPLASDEVLLRRMYLVTIGRLPSSTEARAYFSDQRVDKREQLVDRLLSDPGFDLMWALRWSDLLRNEEKVMSQAGAAKYHDWLREQSARDRPINEMVAELITATGSTYENPPASFHRTHRDPFVAAESSAQVFLGVRIACAKCHNHPFDVWKQDDYYGLSAFFTTIERKQIDNKPKDGLDKHIITGDEVISLADKQAEIMHPGRSSMVMATPLANEVQLVSHQANAETNENGTPLQRLAAWMTNENLMFDRNMANRVWYQYFGKGIVDPPDDFRDSNPPSNPKLLDYIAQELHQNQYSVRYLSRLILTSNTFARASASDFSHDNCLPANPYFAGYPIHRMPAETLLDAISTATDMPSRFRNGRDEEDESISVYRAIEMPGVPKRAGFLTTFGKPNRLLSCECERTSQVSLGQSLALINGVELREKLSSKFNAVVALIEAGKDDPTILEELYLSALTRLPSVEEGETMMAYLKQSTDRRQALEDILWSLMNSKEFIMIR